MAATYCFSGRGIEFFLQEPGRFISRPFVISRKTPARFRLKTLLLTCLLLAVVAILLINAAVAQALTVRAQPQLRYADWVYDPAIATPLLYPRPDDPNDPRAALGQPLIALDDARPLLLQFDDLANRGADFRAKILHCNGDWTPSNLTEVEYLNDYNDFPLYDFQTASGTKVAYQHYTFEVPRVKLSGNYVLLVYRGRNAADVVLTRRFMVFENQVNIGAKVSFSTNVQLRNTHQQVDLEIRYGSYPLLNPREDLRVVIRQNYRWDNALTGLKPFTVNEFDRRLEYRAFNGENAFPAGNEFRYFDIRRAQTRGFGVNTIERGGQQNTALLNFDAPQQGLAYVQQNDLDGQFAVENAETGRGATEADYWQVVFSLKMPEQQTPVYVVGGFNFFHLTEANRLIFNPTIGVYQATLPLKQGVYNYAYAVPGPNGAASTPPIEGSYSVTQNTYDILVYHRPPGARADRLVGYRVARP